MFSQEAQEYNKFLTDNGIEYKYSAEDLLCERFITKFQRNWLNNFVKRWENITA